MKFGSTRMAMDLWTNNRPGRGPERMVTVLRAGLMSLETTAKVPVMDTRHLDNQASRIRPPNHELVFHPTHLQVPCDQLLGKVRKNQRTQLTGRRRMVCH